MKLPSGETAYVSPPKLVNYLLSPSHPVGGPKARFFRSVGFDETNAAALEQALIDIARSEDVTEVEQTRHGTKDAVEGDLRTPVKGVRRIRTIWIVDVGQERPRFVTAYPL
ncbi:MAG TPA: hypothetical protein VLJ61_04475 [Pyrinomonadaceae bacterium]|nr:hypothetical protein [Pyrinomonadaceae bacterium]